MIKSILQNKKECYVCQTTLNLELHHCIYGTAKRKLADKYKLTVWLCNKHHTGIDGVHTANKQLDTHLKQLSQKEFINEYKKTTDDFIKIFGKGYL